MRYRVKQTQREGRERPQSMAVKSSWSLESVIEVGLYFLTTSAGTKYLPKPSLSVLIYQLRSQTLLHGVVVGA